MRMISHIILDVDGTLTNGSVYYSDNGQEMKQFNVKDGLGIVQAQKMGICFVVLTGRKSAIVERRMQELGVKYIFQGVANKKEFLGEFFQKNEIDTLQVGYIGDDLNDLSAMQLCAFKACPKDACEEIREIADYVAAADGGKGAVRDILEYLLKMQGRWMDLVEHMK